MNNLFSYCGLVDARISASEKDLPVKRRIAVLINSFYFRCNHKESEKHFHSSEVLHFHLYESHGVGDFVCDICGAILKPPINNLQNHKGSFQLLALLIIELKSHMTC